MADNLVNENASQLTGENANQNNSINVETDKEEILPTPPTQFTTDTNASDRKEENIQTEEVKAQDENMLEDGVTECEGDISNARKTIGATENNCSDIERKKDAEGKKDLLQGTDNQDNSKQNDGDIGNCIKELPPNEVESENVKDKVEIPPKEVETENDNDKVELTPNEEETEKVKDKMELAPKDVEESEKVKDKEADLADTVNEGACGNSNDPPADDSESIHQVKWVYFKKKQVPIITQNENGPCPLLALINVLLLQNRVTLPQLTEIVSASQLMHHLGDSVLQNVPGEDGVSTQARLNFEQNMGDAMAVMYKLQTGLDVNVRFTGVRDFEYTSECIIFDLLQIPLYHGWLVDPQNGAEVEALGKCSYNQLVEKIILQKTSDQHDLVSQALVAEEFLENSASQLTYHGLCELCTQLKEDELAVLFRNNHFTTLYKNKGELFQLVTDQGFLQETNVVWETLSNVEGDCHFVDSEFRTYTKLEPPPLAKEPPNVPINSEEQIDHDYLVALSLQQEQQPVDQGPWSAQNAHMSDEELAKHLQEEERRAAMAEANDPQRRQGQPAPQQHSQQPSSQRRAVRGNGQHKEEKKDLEQLLEMLSQNKEEI